MFTLPKFVLPKFVLLKCYLVDRQEFRRGLRLTAVVAIVTLIALVVLIHRRPSTSSGQTPAAPGKRVEATTPKMSEMAAAGRRVFAGSCGMAYCHGTDGVGGAAPRLRNREYTVDRLTRVISDGIPGTAMPAFGKGLSRVQISQLVAYLLSVNREIQDAQKAVRTDRVDPHFGGGGAAPEGRASGAATSPPSGPAGASDFGPLGLVGDWQAGETIFFDPANLANCRVCHTLQGRGGKVASDLSRLSSAAPSAILRRILSPGVSAEGRHAKITVRLKSGGLVSGILRDEDEKTCRVFDTATMPPVSRTFLRDEIAGIDRHSTTGCPGGYGARFSLQQLLDLVALIRTTDQSQPPRVTLEDILK